jgi:hypothetical protein
VTRIVTGQLITTNSLWDFDGDAPFEDIETIDMDYLSPFRLMLCLSNSRIKGMLGVETEDETIVITVSDGNVLKTASSVESDDEVLGRVLLRDRLLSVEKLEDAAERVDATGRDLGHVIFEMKFMSARNMVRAIKATHHERVNRILTASSATYTLAPSDALGGRITVSPSPERLPRVLSRYLYQALRHYTFEDMKKRFAPIGHCRLVVPQSRKPHLRDHPLAERELHTIDRLLAGSHSMGEIIELSSKLLDQTGRLLLMLFIFDLIEIIGVWE